MSEVLLVIGRTHLFFVISESVLIFGVSPTYFLFLHRPSGVCYAYLLIPSLYKHQVVPAM